MHFMMTHTHTTNSALSASLIANQAPALPDLSHWSVDLKIDISVKLLFANNTKKSIQKNEGHLPLVPYCTNQYNARVHAFLSSIVIAYDLISLSTQINQHYHETWTSVYETYSASEKTWWHVQSAPNCIAQGPHLTTAVILKWMNLENKT